MKGHLYESFRFGSGNEYARGYAERVSAKPLLADDVLQRFGLRETLHHFSQPLLLCIGEAGGPVAVQVGRSK